MFANETDPERHAQNIRLAAVQTAERQFGQGMADADTFLDFARRIEAYLRNGSDKKVMTPEQAAQIVVTGSVFEGLQWCDEHKAACKRGCLLQCRDAMGWKDA